MKFWNARQYQLEDVLDWSAYTEHLPSVLKQFDGITTPTNGILILDFQDCLKLFIYTKLDKKDCNFDNWQAVVERVMVIKTRVVQ